MVADTKAALTGLPLLTQGGTSSNNSYSFGQQKFFGFGTSIHNLAEIISAPRR
jgi:hypothetical protein